MSRNDPRQITARFDSHCAETGKLIKKGEQCIYYPKGKRVYHTESKQAVAYRQYMQDIHVLGANY